jgi:hypothetical protein
MTKKGASASSIATRVGKGLSIHNGQWHRPLRGLLQFAVGIDDHGHPILLGIAVLEEAADLRQQVRIDLFRCVELRLPEVGWISPGWSGRKTPSSRTDVALYSIASRE